MNRKESVLHQLGFSSKPMRSSYKEGGRAKKSNGGFLPHGKQKIGNTRFDRRNPRVGGSSALPDFDVWAWG